MVEVFGGLRGVYKIIVFMLKDLVFWKDFG